jgi:ketosteroid isomerase-like protein
MSKANESAVRDLLEQWAAAVRAKKMPGIVANHSLDFRMFDVPPPFESRGLAAYEDSWKLF